MRGLYFSHVTATTSAQVSCLFFQEHSRTNPGSSRRPFRFFSPTTPDNLHRPVSWCAVCPVQQLSHHCKPVIAAAVRRKAIDLLPTQQLPPRNLVNSDANNFLIDNRVL